MANCAFVLSSLFAPQPVSRGPTDGRGRSDRRRRSVGPSVCHRKTKPPIGERCGSGRPCAVIKNELDTEKRTRVNHAATKIHRRRQPGRHSLNHPPPPPQPLTHLPYSRTCRRHTVTSRTHRCRPRTVFLDSPADNYTRTPYRCECICHRGCSTRVDMGPARRSAHLKKV